jgi:adenine specific DNA methylase Mod
MTYSNENDIVLDFTMGSGSTGVSCKLTNRKFIGVELEKEYYDIAEDRIQRIQDNTFEPLVTELDFQLTSQLPVELKTTPDKKHEVFKKLSKK